jgi:hypothetical protein
MGREGFGRIGKRSRVHAVLISACYRLAYTHIDPKRPRPCSTLAAAASLSLARPRPDPIHRARQASRRSEDREATASGGVLTDAEMAEFEQQQTRVPELEDLERLAACRT